ncbi:MAG: TetR/AcrR family transcriptional regulator [Propionibacteriaceae bacterium]|jgi:AcrR family transcriptional regulator|nr:TetR/AcrR family transcriptional regulator [Propionibacteriaceae bacterium]
MPKRTFERLDADKRERVMRAAIDQFLEHGFEKANVGVIAQNAQIAKGSVYQYFDDKRDLFLHCLTWSIEFFMAAIDRQTPLADMDVYDYFRSGTQDRIELMRSEPTLMAFAMAYSTGRFAALTADITRELKRIADEEEIKLIRNGQRRGTVRTDLDDAALLLFFQGVTEKFGTSIVADMVGDSDEAVARAQARADQMVELLRGGMRG